MKKLLAIALMFAFLGTLVVGCGDKGKTEKTTKETKTETKPNP